MSEFEKELEKNMKLNKVAYERENIYSDFLVSKRDIERIFKDWQPPKELVEVPEITQKQADTLSDYKSGSNSLLEYLRVEVKKKDYNRFARAWLDGYTVKKEQLYVLKHIDMSKFSEDSSLYLSKSIKAEVFGKYDHMRVADGVDVSEIEQCHFTQSEIDKLNIGSYVKIRVEP